MGQQYAEDESELISLIVFKVGEEEFAIDLLDVKEIIQAQQIRRLPQGFDFIEGIYNYRGEIIHIINLKKKLRLNDYVIYRKELIQEKEKKEKLKKEKNKEEKKADKKNEKEEAEEGSEEEKELIEETEESIEILNQNKELVGIEEIIEGADSKKKFIIIVNFDETNIGFYVDDIINVSHVNYDNLDALSPIFQTSISMEYIRAIIKFKDKPRIFIDLKKVLNEEEKESIKQIN